MIAYIAAGSNIGDRESFLYKALVMVSENESIVINKISSIYETASMGNEEQNNFLNLVFSCETSLTPYQLLQELKSIEIKSGRIEREKWSEREIDLDILLYDTIIINGENISIPHKEMKNRDFVLLPLMEINPYLKDPVSNFSWQYFLDRIEKKYIVGCLKNKFLISENDHLTVKYE